MSKLKNFSYDFSKEINPIQKLTSTRFDELDINAPLWVNIEGFSATLKKSLVKKMNISKFLADILFEEETRPRGLVHEDCLLLILRGVNITRDALPNDMISVRILITKTRLITVTRRHVNAITYTHDFLKKFTISDPITCFAHLIENLFAQIEQSIDEMDSILDRLEEGEEELRFKDMQEQLGEVRQSIISFRRYLFPQRDAILKLTTERLEWLKQMDLSYFSNNMNRYTEDLDAARERASVLQDKLLTRSSEQLNNKMYIISILAVVFAPYSVVTGIFGMNIIVPGANSKITFWIAVTAIAALTLILFTFFKKKDWL